MSEEKAVVAEPKDDAVVVHDQVVDPEKVHDDLVAAVTKKLDSADAVSAPADETKQPGDTPEKPGKPEEPPQGEGEKEEAGPSLGKELQTRAKGAGLTEELAGRLHESGQLEETLAAFDRSLIEYVQSKEEKASEESPKAKGQRDKQPPPKDQDLAETPLAETPIPALDPDVYDEELVKRDAYQQSRIDALEARIEELIEGQQGGFDEWMDGTLTDLGVDTSDDEKCQAVFKAYGAMCDAFGKNFNSRDKSMVERAYAAMYPQDVFKQQQRQTVDRLRDASGKFLTSSKSQGGPPPKGATNEEVQQHLVSNVTAYLKEKGVQMSGV